MAFQFNFAGVEASGPLDEGNYVFQITDIEYKVNKNNNGFLQVQYVVVEPEEFTGRKIRDKVFTTEASRWRLKQWLEAVTGKEWADDEMEFDPTDVVGSIVRGSVFHQTSDDNKTYANIKDYWPYEVI